MDRKSIVLTEGFFIFFDNTHLIVEENIMQRNIYSKLEWIFDQEEHSMAPKIPHTPQWVIDLNNIHFYKLFRMERSTFNAFLSAIRKCDDKNLLLVKYHGGHHPIKDDMQIVVFLKYMSSQDTLMTIGYGFRISSATVMKIVNIMLYFVLKLKKKYIKFPKTPSERETVTSNFRKYPGTLGAIDGTHVNVSVEQSQQDSYIDRYRQHSINCMMICDRNKLFLYSFVGFPGSAHDSRVFENSVFFRTIARNGANYFFHDDNKFHLIGDSAFTLKKWLMVPYRDTGNLTEIQRRHNKRLSSDRVIIEHAIGLWKERWRRLHFIKTYNISKTIEIASAACVLHNFCLLNDDFWVTQENVDHYSINNNETDTVVAGNREAKLKRDRIAANLN